MESIFATEITHKIEKKQFEGNFEKNVFENGYYSLHCKRVHPIAFQLLFQSNIWRASISGQPVYQNFKLSPQLQERIRFNLDLFLPQVHNFKLALSEKEWISCVEYCRELFDILPMAVFKAENIENKDVTYEFFDNVHKTPYHIILNEYIIFLFENDKQWTDDFFEIRNEADLSVIINDSAEKSKILVIPNERYFNVIEKIRTIAVKQRIQKIEKQSIKELQQQGIPVTQERIREMIIQKVNELKTSQKNQE